MPHPPGPAAATPASVHSLLAAAEVQLRQGQAAEAERLIQAILQQHPGAIAARRLLARLAMATQRPQLAVAQMAEASRLAPNDGALRCEFGCLLAHLGRHADAVRELQASCQLQAQSADAWYFLAIALQRLHRHHEALAALRRSQQLHPDMSRLLQPLALAEFHAGHPDDALPLWQELHKMRPDDCETLLKLGETLSRLGDNDAAVSLYRAALKRDPQAADLWMALAQAEEDQGEREAAAHSYRRALTLRPDWAFPLSGLLGLRRGNADPMHIEQAERLRGKPDLGDPERALIGYELGKVYDGLGNYPQAMACWDDANAARRRVIGEFDPEVFHRQISAARSVFTAEQIARWKHGSDDARPLFIVGMPRSGTTLTEQILAAHPHAAGCGELPDMALIAKNLAAEHGAGGQWTDAIAGLDRARIASCSRLYLRAASRHAPATALRLVDKAPMNFLLLGLIARLFPRARIVWCRRDPRDVAVSIYGENFALSERFATTWDGIGLCIRAQEQLMRLWQSLLPLPILELDYQQLALDPEANARRLIEFAGLEWNPACLQFHASQRNVQTPSRWQVRQPVHTRSIGRWKNYASALAPLQRVLDQP